MERLDLADQLARERAFWTALQGMIRGRGSGMVVQRALPGPWEPSETLPGAREGVRKLTGYSWETREEALAWWTANKFYLRWSHAEKRFTIDSDAKRFSTFVLEYIPVGRPDNYSGTKYGSPGESQPYQRNYAVFERTASGVDSSWYSTTKVPRSVPHNPGAMSRAVYNQAAATINNLKYYQEQVERGHMHRSTAQQSQECLDRLAKLIAEPLRSRKHALAWWDDNGAYLEWSSRRELLTINHTAKRRGEVSLQFVGDGLPSRYWAARIGNRGMRNERRQGDVLLAEIRSGSTYELWKFDPVEVGRPTHKRQMLLLTVRKAIERLERRRAGQEEAGSDADMQLLERLTQQNFRTSAEWISWYEAVSDCLCPATDGLYLTVVAPPSKPAPFVLPERYATTLARAEQGDRDAQHEIGTAYIKYAADRCPDARAQRLHGQMWRQRAAAGGHSLAQLWIAEWDWGDARESGDYSTAVAAYERAAELGARDAQYWIGNASWVGAGVPQDRAIAVQWYKRAAKQGHARAQYNLAAAYGAGEGVKANARIAERWRRRFLKQELKDARDKYRPDAGVATESSARWLRLGLAAVAISLLLSGVLVRRWISRKA